MFMQVFIERVRRYQRSMVTVYLYFVGVQNLEFKYPYRLICVLQNCFQLRVMKGHAAEKLLFT